LGVVGGGSKFDLKQVNLKMTLKVKPIMGKKCFKILNLNIKM